MKRIFASVILLLEGLLLEAQTFSDCVDVYHTQVRSIEQQRFQKKLGNDEADSLVRVVDLTLDSCLIGTEMSEYKFTSVANRIYTNESLKGKVVMFNFWALSCAPCIAEIPVLNKLHTAYRHDDFVLISVLWDSEENFEKFLVREPVKKHVFFDVIPDAKAIMKDQFKIKISPTNLFVDKEGKIFMRTTGSIADSKHEGELEEKLRSIIDTALNQ